MRRCDADAIQMIEMQCIKMRRDANMMNGKRLGSQCDALRYEGEMHISPHQSDHSILNMHKTTGLVPVMYATKRYQCDPWQTKCGAFVLITMASSVNIANVYRPSKLELNSNDNWPRKWYEPSVFFNFGRPTN